MYNLIEELLIIEESILNCGIYLIVETNKNWLINLIDWW